MVTSLTSFEDLFDTFDRWYLFISCNSKQKICPSLEIRDINFICLKFLILKPIYVDKEKKKK